jgi:hypothetical protein
MTKTLGLRVGGIIVQLNENGSGSIKSNLHYSSYHPDAFSNRATWKYYEGAIDGLESLILCHACKGIDVLSKKYTEGVQTAINALENQCAD